ncbi:MAG: hypothetical protein KC561_14895, partial [Myxococcales bacterium]|nr:hypothetical protein [Myxococcales bacterium]
MVLSDVPWLLDDFQRDTFSSGGVYYRQECRDESLPFEDDFAANLSLAASNPIPDGRTRRRELKLLDGVLINQETMVILFEEDMDSFFCTDGFVGCDCLDGDSCYGDGIACTDGTCQVEVSGDNPDATGLSNSSYGWMVLTREPTDLDDTDANGNQVADVYEGSAVTDDREDPEGILTVTCSEDLQDELGFDIDDLDPDVAADVISELILGVSASVDSDPLESGDSEQVHYFCEDTGLFDGGPDNDTTHGIPINNQGDSCLADIPGVCQDGGYNAAVISNECEPDEDFSIDPNCLVRRSECALGSDLSDCGTRYTDDADVRIECPAGSEVVFFTVEGLSQADIADLDCQEDGTCQDVLNDWATTSDPMVQYAPIYRCESGGAYCDLNRFDLRDGKEFFPAGSPDAVLPSFRSELESAFRYRTRFRNRGTGSVVGFAPEVCIPNSNRIPYCYDPDQIEALRDRVDCLVAVWQDDIYLDMQESGNQTYEDAIELLDDFLAFNFSYEEACVDGTYDCDCSEPYACDTYDGFERLYAELLIMMGDESYTEAFASRFDLAGTNLVSFNGQAFEDGGINLSGVAGYEMYSLYRAVQYYKEALDRFYAMSPLVWQAVSESIGDREDIDNNWSWRESFVTPEMVSSYME